MAMLRQAQRSLAKTDVFTYGEYVFGYEAAAHHRQMVEFALNLIDTGQSGVILAPRGAAKSTWLNTIMLSWLVALRPDIRIGLFSQKDKKAEDMSGAIMNTLGESEAFTEIFGNLRGLKWSAGGWLRKDSPWAQSKDRTMVAGGAVSSSAVSKRFSLVLCDDILDENNTATIDQREKVETWFWKTLSPTLVPGGSTIYVGTRWTEDDLAQKLIEINKWPSLVIPAIYPEKHPQAGESYWPQEWPVDRLYAKREDVGWDNFACSYLNDISGSRDGMIFRRDWWKHEYFDDLPSDRTYVFTIGIDLATSVRERADWTAGVLTAKCNRGEHWVLHHARTKTDGGHGDFVRSLANYAAERHWPVSRIVIENNQAQEAVVVGIQRDHPDLPIVGRRTDSDKRSRARGAASRYESHRVHHHSSLRGRELETELLSFDKGHDDLVDALGLSMDLSAASGTIVAVNGPLRSSEGPTALSVLVGRELPFLDGPRLVPAHVASMLIGIDTEGLTYEGAVQAMNTKRLNNYISDMTKGMLRGR